jgi:hypothetical protein
LSTWTRTSHVPVLSLLLTLVQFAVPQTGAAQTPANAANSKDCVQTSVGCDLNATVTEIVAPDSPAFTILGLSPNNVSKPNSPASLAASVLNAFDDNGHFQSGAAIDVVPFLILRAKSYSLGQYTDKGIHAYTIRVLSRTSVSFATVKGTSSPDTAVRMATGIRISLLDFGDPRAAFQKCVGTINIPLDPNHPESPSDPQLATDLKKCRDDAAKKVWNATSFVIAGAPTWVSSDGSSSNLSLNGGGYWASFAYGLGNWGQLTASARRQTGQLVAPPGSSSTASSSSFVLQDSTIAGGSFKFGRADFNGLVQGLYIGKRTAGLPDSYPEFGFGLEKKLTNGVYLELTYRYDVTKKQTSGVLANLKWSFSQQAKLAPH